MCVCVCARVRLRMCVCARALVGALPAKMQWGVSGPMSRPTAIPAAPAAPASEPAREPAPWGSAPAPRRHSHSHQRQQRAGGGGGEAGSFKSVVKQCKLPTQPARQRPCVRAIWHDAAVNDPGTGLIFCRVLLCESVRIVSTSTPLWWQRRVLDLEGKFDCKEMKMMIALEDPCATDLAVYRRQRWWRGGGGGERAPRLAVPCGGY